MIQWIITCCLLIAAVILLRAVGRNRLSARVRYALWLLVLVRLLVPFNLGESTLSVMNFLPREEAAQTTTADVSNIPNTSDMIGTYDPSDMTEMASSIIYPTEITGPADTVEQEDPVTTAMNILWFAGCAMTGAILLSCNLRLSGALKRSRKEVPVADYLMPVYETAVVETPCMFGLLKPAVYIIPELTEDEEALGYVLAHEQTHRRHLDHIWALLRCVCLAVHWYNPMVWLAAYLSREDGELACDEGTLKRIGEDKRTAYGETLIALTCTGHSGLMTTATTMTGSKGGLKERIKRIADRRKASVLVLIIVLLLAAVAVVAVFTGQTTDVGVNGVWRTSTSVLGVDVPSGTEGWLEYELKDGSGRVLMYQDGELFYAAPVSYTIEGDALYLTVIDEKTSTGDVREYTWTRAGDSLTLSAYKRDMLFTGVEREYPKFIGAEGYVEIESLWQGSVKAELTELEEAQLLAMLREGEAVKQNGVGLVGEKSLYYIFIRQEDGNLAVTMADDLMGVEGGVYKLPAAEEIRVFLQELGWHVPQYPTTPKMAMEMTALDSGLLLSLSRSGDGEQRVGDYKNLETANNAVYFYEYRLKPLGWTETEAPANVKETASWAVTLIGEYWSLTAYDGCDAVLFETAADGFTDRWYLLVEGELGASADAYSILRQWYDEMEQAAQPEIVIPDRGQTYLEAAEELLQQLDARSLQYTSGSKFRMSYRNTIIGSVELAEAETERRRQRGELSAEEYVVYANTVFVPENEAALSWNMAGNTIPVADSDRTYTDAPEGSFVYFRVCVFALQDDGWHLVSMGTG